MPVNLTIIHPQDFIRTTIDGALDLSTSRQVLLDIASILQSPGTYHVLIDIRNAQVSLSIPNLYDLGVAVASQRAVAHSKTAILASMCDAERTRFRRGRRAEQGCTSQGIYFI